jgi:L-ascorbate metabolism protein UlaG (beta-lactamase superfamily)
MDISYLGHSSFRIKGKTGVVVTDPFDPSMVGLKYSGVEGDIVTISHNHDDHNKADLVKGVKKIISGPGEYEIMGISILGFSSYHDNKKGEEKGKNTIYVYEVDGLRLAHLGDLGHTLSEGTVGGLGDIDILFVPVGDEGVTIGPKEALQVVQDIEPYYVIPMHYQMNEAKNSSLSLLPVEKFLEECGMTVEKLPKFSIKKEEINEDQNTKVIVLTLK